MNKRTKKAHKTSFYAADDILKEFYARGYEITENAGAMMVLLMSMPEEVQWVARQQAKNNPDVKSAILAVRKAWLDASPTTALTDEFKKWLKRHDRE